MDEKEKYITPMCDVVVFEQPDVLTLSDGGEGPGEQGTLG